MTPTLRTRLLIVRALLAAVVAGGGFGLAQAQPAAKVTHVTGTLVETDATGRTRVLAADSSVSQGARLRTAANSHARLKFSDGTDLFLRSNTEYVIDRYRYVEEKPTADGFISNLVKGGFRQVTGLIGRRNPGEVRIKSGTATIGIRGTDFAVRNCEETCIVEPEARDRESKGDSPVAQIVILQGSAIAHDALTARERPLLRGAKLYAGDVVATGAGSHAALYFRDGTRITLAENSVLGIGEYAFDAADPANGRATFELGLGGARVWTGAIAKANPDGFVFRTPTAAIAPRGSLWDVVVSTAQAVVGAVGQTAEQAAQAAADAAAQAAQAVQDAARAAAQAVQDAARAAAQAAQDAARAAAQAVQGTAQKVGKSIQRAGQGATGALRQTGQAVGGAAKQVGQAVVAVEQQVVSTLEDAGGESAVETAVTQISVLDGAAIVTTSQGSERIDPTTPGLRVAGDGRLVPATSRAIVDAPDPSRFDADPVRLFGDSGIAKEDAGVYVIVHDGAVSLAQGGAEIVLVKGEAGFADAKNSPPQLLDVKPPVLRHDRLLGESMLGSQMCSP